MKGIAKTNVVLPRPHGYVRRGAIVDLPVSKWDVKEHSFLKHFDPVEAPKAPPAKGKTEDILK